MKFISPIHRAEVPDIQVRDIDRDEKELRNTIEQNINHDPELMQNALSAIVDGNSAQMHEVIDQVVGNEDTYVRVTHVDIAIGPGFCDCDCECPEA
ncbi:MAG: hypothetical protein ABH859_08250 [Pseudomonadota bacterium]